MARHSIYLDPYHSTLVKYLAKSSTVSATISNALDKYAFDQLKQIPNEDYLMLVSELGTKSLSVNINNIPNWRLREDILAWLRKHKPRPKAKLKL
jgi:hypothetical protein